MKPNFLLLLLLCVTVLSAQQPDQNEKLARDPRADQLNFVPNEVLVKFKDEVTIQVGTNLKSAGISSVDQILKANGVASLEKLFQSETKLKRALIVKDPQGQDMKIPSLHNIYKLVLPQLKSTGTAPVNLFQFIEELKALPEVEYAEPNYIYSVDDLKSVGPILTADDVANLQNTNLKSAQTAVTPNDPMYGQQWYIPAVKADLVWEQTTGDTTQVIAILDTGVDWNHPDLKNKIWRNKAEISGNGRDDDGNGLIDDFRGWDYINNDNNPTDDNSHGTHVAGIAAAESNNGIGIAGVNWKAKIMPLKVFQSSGRGDAANIAKGIIYATQKGATVINMSFGSYARSLAMEDALANAYATTILVAAAGNDGIDIGDCPPGGPFYPAALSFVLGVMAPDGDFSNSDCTGPTFSLSASLNNYEMKAPGTNVISTIPNGNYRVYQGTSMAAPVVSAALSLYRKLIPYEEETNEFMWVKLIQSTGQYLDINKALTIVPKPEVWFLNNVMVDTIGTDDKDGRVDAGETIQLWFRARNTGGQVDSVYWKIRLAEFEDTSTCKIVKPTSFLGSISPYATRTSEKDPMKFIISKNVAHDRDITFDLSSWYKGATDTIVQKFVFTAENGEQLSGIMDTTLVLTHDKLWLVNESFKVGSNGHLIIKPGTHIIIYEGKAILVTGKVTAIGTSDSLIVVKPRNSWGGSGIVGPDASQIRTFKYCYFENFTQPLSGYGFNASNCIFNGMHFIYIINEFSNNLCVFYGSSSNSRFYSGSFSYNNFIDKSPSGSMGSPPVCSWGYLKYNNFINCYMPEIYSSLNDSNSWYNSFIYPNNVIIRAYPSMRDFLYVRNQYVGTTNSEKIDKLKYDFFDNASCPYIVFSPLLTAPSDSCHAIVWKVLVNGKDAQDEKVEPVGEGKQRFDVYFNRTMDKTIAPQVAFGVRYPFSSNAVNEEGTWSADGRIYTAYKTVKLFTGDGINRIRVTGAKDLEGWEIPTEDMRFEFLISAAASASLDFMSTPGLGKVNLEWNNNDLADGLGFNMYRMEQINETTLSKPVMINKTLITDTLYTDFAVTPNKKYYYYYKILRTNLSETDSSKVVSAIPFTASKGDANGDLSVNVLDITTIVAYLLNNNPQPFITEAADLNSDGQINVLDIVGVVNLVLGGPKSAVIATSEQVKLYLQNDTLFADAPVAIGGIQFDISGSSTVEEIQKLKALEGFESGYSTTDKSLRLLYYSLSGKTIAAGTRIPLLRLKKGSGVSSAIFGDQTGSSIPVNYLATGVWNLSDNLNNIVAELGQNFPNPLNRQTTIPIWINEPVDEAVIRIVNVMGQEVDIIRIDNPTVGEHLLNWNSGTNKGLLAYLLEIRRGNQRFICPVKKMVVQ